MRQHINVQIPVITAGPFNINKVCEVGGPISTDFSNAGYLILSFILILITDFITQYSLLENMSFVFWYYNTFTVLKMCYIPK